VGGCVDVKSALDTNSLCFSYLNVYEAKTDIKLEILDVFGAYVLC
jgi:hypothetical protein